jgi:hypothetical protein
VSEPRAVATGSGRAAKFISARIAVILFREVSFLIRGDFLIRSLPLKVLTQLLAENVAHLVDEFFVFEIARLDFGQLFQQFALFTRQAGGRHYRN